jgi:hypothetical protein
MRAFQHVAGVVLVAFVADRSELLQEHELGKADDGVERRAQFVAGVGEELALGPVGRLRRIDGFTKRRLVSEKGRDVLGGAAEADEIAAFQAIDRQPAQLEGSVCPVAMPKGYLGAAKRCLHPAEGGALVEVAGLGGQLVEALTQEFARMIAQDLDDTRRHVSEGQVAIRLPDPV